MENITEENLTSLYQFLKETFNPSILGSMLDSQEKFLQTLKSHKALPSYLLDFMTVAERTLEKVNQILVGRDQEFLPELNKIEQLEKQLEEKTYEAKGLEFKLTETEEKLENVSPYSYELDREGVQFRIDEEYPRELARVRHEDQPAEGRARREAARRHAAQLQSRRRTSRLRNRKEQQERRQ